LVLSLPFDRNILSSTKHPAGQAFTSERSARQLWPSDSKVIRDLPRLALSAPYAERRDEMRIGLQARTEYIW
jgi:hypothetical protein